MLSLWDFKEQHQLPLDVECMNVLYARMAHLKDRDFVLIDRLILELIDKFNTTRNKKNDNHFDFKSAIWCLRNTSGFVEGSILEDENTILLFKRVENMLLSSDYNINSDWFKTLFFQMDRQIRCAWNWKRPMVFTTDRVFGYVWELWNISSSWPIPLRDTRYEYFLDLNRLAYTLYQEQFLYRRSTLQLCHQQSQQLMYQADIM